MIVKSLFSIQRSLDRSIPISSKISRAKIQGSNDLAIKICTQPLKSNTKEAIEQEQDTILLLFPFLDFSRRFDSIRTEANRVFLSLYSPMQYGYKNFRFLRVKSRLSFTFPPPLASCSWKSERAVLYALTYTGALYPRTGSSP